MREDKPDGRYDAVHTDRLDTRGVHASGLFSFWWQFSSQLRHREAVEGGTGGGAYQGAAEIQISVLHGDVVVRCTSLI